MCAADLQGVLLRKEDLNAGRGQDLQGVRRESQKAQELHLHGRQFPVPAEPPEAPEPRARRVDIDQRA